MRRPTDDDPHVVRRRTLVVLVRHGEDEQRVRRAGAGCDGRSDEARRAGVRARSRNHGERNERGRDRGEKPESCAARATRATGNDHERTASVPDSRVRVGPRITALELRAQWYGRSR